jgi:hypothetical protein
MNDQATNHPEMAPPSLGELFTRYLSDTNAGAVDSRPGLVETYDSGMRHPVDAQLAWQGALASLTAIAGQGASFEKPSEWAALVQALESRPAVAMAAGNYPQLLRDLPGLLHADRLAELLQPPNPVHELSGLATWAARISKSSFAGRMLAAGVSRLAGQFDAASQCLLDEQKLSACESQILLNERAALAWHRGDREAAVQLWKQLPVSAVGQFNLGMAGLFDKPAQALPLLQSACTLLAEEDPWRHLAGIYLALAEMRA